MNPNVLLGVFVLVVVVTMVSATYFTWRRVNRRIKQEAGRASQPLLPQATQLDSSPRAADGAPSGSYPAQRSPSAQRVSSVVAFVFLSVVFSLAFGIGACQFYLYRSGTPTTVTLERCVSAGKGGPNCYGRWSVGGQSQTGRIEQGLGRDYSIGSTLDVRVRGDSGTAYTARAAYLPLTLSAAIAVIIVGMIVFRRRRPR
jgi:hypothetical protein